IPIHKINTKSIIHTKNLLLLSSSWSWTFFYFNMTIVEIPKETLEYQDKEFEQILHDDFLPNTHEIVDKLLLNDEHIVWFEKKKGLFTNWTIIFILLVMGLLLIIPAVLLIIIFGSNAIPGG